MWSEAEENNGGIIMKVFSGEGGKGKSDDPCYNLLGVPEGKVYFIQWDVIGILRYHM